MLEPFLGVVGWMDFFVVSRMDTTLGNMKDYQILLGIVSVMKRIYIYCNCKDYCPHIPSLTMLQMLLT